jgi:hypothetical protein
LECPTITNYLFELPEVEGSVLAVIARKEEVIGLEDDVLVPIADYFLIRSSQEIIH